jgi:hypothetical protein
MRNFSNVWIVSLLVGLWGCADIDLTERGLHATFVAGQARGPTILFQPLHQPEPLIPFPNDLALRVDADGSTHANISMQAPAKTEQRNRKHFNEVDGFSGLTPITIAFDGPLDLTTVNDDTVFVVNVTPGSKRFGERLPLDLGRGWFPHDAEPHAYEPFDPYAGFNSYVMPPDNKIDTDGDGTPDKWVYHYEVKTHTLDIRPLLPLESGARYGVFLTRGVKGWSKDGKYGAVVSPFDVVNHDSQTQALKLALPSLNQVGVQAEDVAFAWTLSTGDLARTFRKLRDGLYGSGPFAWLNAQFPAKVADVYDTEIAFDGDKSYKDYPIVPRDHSFIVQGAFMKEVFALINLFQPGVADSFVNVAHVVFGEFTTPNFRATSDNVWQLDMVAGTAVVAKEQVPFLLVVPKTTANHKPPFPVTIYAHATGTSRVECLLLADRLAQAGIATFAIDAVGHGPVLTEPRKMIEEQAAKTGMDVGILIKAILAPLIFTDTEKRFPEGTSVDKMLDVLLNQGFVQQLAVKGRAVDDNGDCYKKGGEAYYAPDAFRLRDAMRQTTFDFIVAVRMLRALSNSHVPPPPTDPRTATKAQLMPSLLAGDFDMDGQIDVGGDKVPYFMMGVSLGGIHTALTAPLEPAITHAAAVVPGAGLADIFMRTALQSVVTPLMHSILGPMVVGCPRGEGKVDLTWDDDADNCNKTETLSYVDETNGLCLPAGVMKPTARGQLQIPAGATITVRNLENGESREQVAAADGHFAVAVSSDKGDRVSVQVHDTQGKLLTAAELTAPHDGLARQRNTPEFRRFVQLAANALEGADAITVADRAMLDPSPGTPPTNLLMMLSVGDRTVPFTTGVSLARAVGLFGRSTAQDAEPWRAWTEEAIARGLLTSGEGDVPLLNPSKPEGGPGLCRTVQTVPGQPALSALCLADVKGHHEYIAQAGDSDGFPPFQGYKGTFTEYHRNQIVTWFHSLGKHLGEDPCWANKDCVATRNLRSEWDLPLGQTP